MSLPQSTDPFGALPAPAPSGAAGRGPSLVELELAGKAARAQLESWLARARSRARSLFALQLLFSLLAALLIDLLGSAVVAARLGPLAGRALFAALAAIAPLAIFLRYKFSPRGSLAQAALGRDPTQLGALLVAKSPLLTSSGSELLSSIQFRGNHSSSAAKPPVPAPGTSGALLSLLHQRAAKWAETIDLIDALPAKSLRWPALALALGLFASLIAGLRAPQLFRLGVLRLWLGEAAMPIPENEPIAGDLSVTYLYPAYTNLPARVEEGTPGDLKAPRGTEVRLTARADRDLVQAFAVIDDNAIPLEVSGAGNRLLAGSFKLEKRGRWRFRFADKKGRPVAEGPDRAIEIIPDQPPTASISDPIKSEVEVDPMGKLPLAWSALDDYGLGKVTLIWQRPGDSEERIELATPAPGAVARRLSGTYGWEMAPLQLREGDKVSFRVEALDQDAIDGPQHGTSATHTLTVFSAAEHRKEGLQRAQALWERLVVLLADRLEEKPPPSANPANANVSDPSLSLASWYGELQGRDARALQLISEMRKAGSELSKDKLAPRALGRALKYIAAGMSPLVQRTLIARAPLSKPANANAGSVRQLARALEAEIREEEKDVLYLDDLLDQARIEDMKDIQRELKRSREELKRLAEKLRSSPDEATKKQVLAEVQRLRERIEQLAERLQQMAKGIHDEHLNQEATQSAEKEQNMMSQLSEVQRKMQSGDIDSALSQLDKLSKSLEQYEDELSKFSEQTGAQKYSEEAKELRQAAEKLSALKGREEELEKRTGRLRKELRTQAQKRFEQHGGKQLVDKLAEKVAEAKKEIGKIDPHVADSLGLEDTLDAAQERVADLERALKAGDYQEALEQATKAERAAAILQTRLNLEDQWRQLGQPIEVRKSLEAAAQADQPLREVAEALQQTMPDEESQMTPEEQKEMQSQSAEQQQIGEGMQGVREQMAQVGKKVPIFGPQHEQLLQEAQGAMEQAGERLSSKEPRGAEGSEGEALDKLGKFEQAMKDLAKQGGGQGAGMPMPWGEPQGSQEGDEGNGGGDDEGDGDQQSKEHVEIPDAESSRGPQEFRKKLLDAMKQPAPEKFKDKVRGYYEELVK